MKTSEFTLERVRCAWIAQTQRSQYGLAEGAMATEASMTFFYIFLEQIWTNTHQTGIPIACCYNLLTAKNCAILLKASLKNFLAGPFPRILPALCCTMLQRAETKEKWCPFDRIVFSLKNSLSISQVHPWVLQLIWFSPSPSQIHILLALLYPFMTFDKVKLFYSSLRKKHLGRCISSCEFWYTGDHDA